MSSKRGIAVADSCGRTQMLDKVFTKAVSVAVNSISDGDLDECFADTKPHYGANFQKLFVNTLGKAESTMQAAYKDLCIRRDLDDKLRALEAAPPLSALSVSTAAATEDPLAATILELKQLEAEELRAAIRHIEAETKKLNDSVGRLRAQVQTELKACMDQSTALQKAGAV